MAVTETAWDGSASRFTDQQWARACILDMGDCSAAAKSMTAKMRYKLPIREPDGTINAHALGAASAALNGARSPLVACKAAKTAAAKRLVSAYDAAGADAPESIRGARRRQRRREQRRMTTRKRHLADPRPTTHGRSNT